MESIFSVSTITPGVAQDHRCCIGPVLSLARQVHRLIPLQVSVTYDPVKTFPRDGLGFTVGESTRAMRIGRTRCFTHASQVYERGSTSVIADPVNTQNVTQSAIILWMACPPVDESRRSGFPYHRHVACRDYQNLKRYFMFLFNDSSNAFDRFCNAGRLVGTREQYRESPGDEKTSFLSSEGRKRCGSGPQ